MDNKNSVYEEIKNLLFKALVKAGVSYDEEIKLEHPGDEAHGDYATNVALKYFNQPKDPKPGLKNPYDLANKIVGLIPKSNLIEKVEVAGPGFINFYLNKGYLIEELERIISDKENYGLAKKKGPFTGKKYLVEFAHPNTHKMFHIGHLRNATTGETLVRILEANGAKVVRVNYEGDVGLHIAKCLYAIIKEQRAKTKDQNVVQSLEMDYKTIKERVEFLGKMYSDGNKSYETDEKAKEEILRINKMIYAKDPEIYKLWQETRQWSLDYFETIYKRLDTRFDRYYFESECYQRGKELVMEGLKKGIFEESEGAIVFPGEKFGTHTRVFVTKEGNTTYEGKDMALGELQFKEYHPDLIIHCVGPEQADYFKVIFEALGQLFPGMKEKEKHIAYGWVKLKQGKMSSREGNVVLGEWLLDEATNRVHEIMNKVAVQNVKVITNKDTMGQNHAQNFVYDRTQNSEAKILPLSPDVAEKVAAGAVKYSFLKVSLPSEIAFDFQESINFEGDSGPYLQYTYVRTQSVLAKSKLINPIPSIGQAKIQLKIQNDLEEEESSLLRWLYRFPEVVFEAGRSYAPNVICNYLFILAQRYNLFYNKLSILKAENEELINFRLRLSEAVGITIKNGLKLLGIATVERM